MPIWRWGRVGAKETKVINVKKKHEKGMLIFWLWFVVQYLCVKKNPTEMKDHALILYLHVYFHI